MSVWKIRDKDTGLFRGMGQWPDWGKTGRAYNSLAAAKGVIASSDDLSTRWCLRPKNIEIVEFELIEVQRTYSVERTETKRHSDDLNPLVEYSFTPVAKSV